MRGQHFIYRLLLLSISLLLLSSCGTDSYLASSEQRANLADMSKNTDQDILIGVAWPLESSRISYVWGAQLAEAEINANGGLNGRNVRLVIEDEAKYREQAGIGTDRQTRSSYQRAATSLARKFASDPNIIAVIGHHTSLLAIPAATTYYFHGLLYLASTSTNPGLTVSGDDLTFQLLPNDREMVRQLVGFAALNTDGGKKPYKRMVVLNERSKYGDDVASFFADAATELGVKVVSRNSFYKRKPDQTFVDYRSVLFPLRSLEFDAIFLIASKAEAGEIVRQAVEVDIQQPFLGMDVMENQEFLQAAGTAAEGVIVPSAYNENFNLAEPFIHAYTQEHGIPPDTWAALAYDSVKLIAHGIELSHYSTIPSFIANSIRYMDPWFGATGIYKFQLGGANLGKAYVIKRVQDGEFRSLAGGQVPFLLYENRRKTKVSRQQSSLTGKGDMPEGSGNMSISAHMQENMDDSVAEASSFLAEFTPEMLLFDSSQATAVAVVTEVELPDLILNYIAAPEENIVPMVLVPFKPPSDDNEAENNSTTTEPDFATTTEAAQTEALAVTDETAEPSTAQAAETVQVVPVLPIRGDMIPSDSLSSSRLQQLIP